MPTIDGERLLTDLKRIREFGRYKTGVHRPTFSAQDVESRHWLADRIAEAGLEAEIDGIGNVYGRVPEAERRLLMGSHSDTQPRGGWLDGVMGVIYGLEVARAFLEDPDCAGLAVECASWADEESHFASFLGSRSFVGELDEAEIDRAAHREDGTPLRQALRQARFEGRPRRQLDPARYTGYLEAHIEQGGNLERSGNRIGVVTSIVGIFQYRIVFLGAQNHAGTTPMPMRKDAVAALVRLAGRINESFPRLAAERTVWTAGRILVEPNAPSIIPGRAEMYLQFRDTDSAVMQLLEAELQRLVDEAGRDGPCDVTLDTVSRTAPTLMHPAFLDALEEAARRHAPERWMRMPSAAGHDAQILAHRLPAAMLFVPSIGGVSHHYSEDTVDEDIVLGCQVCADAAELILRRS